MSNNTNLMLKHIFLVNCMGNKRPMKKFRRTKLPKFPIVAENFVCRGREGGGIENCKDRGSETFEDLKNL